MSRVAKRYFVTTKLDHQAAVRTRAAPQYFVPSTPGLAQRGLGGVGPEGPVHGEIAVAPDPLDRRHELDPSAEARRRACADGH